MAFLLTMSRIAPAIDSAVPIDQEPRHRLVFENAHVRHFDVQIEPGYVALYHWHRNDGVFVNIGPSDTTAQDLGGEPVARPPRAVGETYFIGYSKKPKAHRVSNTGSRVYHVTDTEILGGCAAPATDYATGRSQTLVVDNDRVFVARIILHPGETTELQGPCGLLVSLYPADLWLEGPGGNELMALPRAGFHWRESQQPYRVRNAGKAVFHGIDIRLK